MKGVPKLSGAFGSPLSTSLRCSAGRVSQLTCPSDACMRARASRSSLEPLKGDLRGCGSSPELSG
eukprot:9465138-Alexandrium_andersonii.AAC.1